VPEKFTFLNTVLNGSEKWNRRSVLFTHLFVKQFVTVSKWHLKIMFPNLFNIERDKLVSFCLSPAQKKKSILILVGALQYEHKKPGVRKLKRTERNILICWEAVHWIHVIRKETSGGSL
jgi:hypothetical protein